MCPKSSILIAVDNEIEAKILWNNFTKVYDSSKKILDSEIEKVDIETSKILFENGSSIEILVPKPKQKHIRGKRSKEIEFWWDLL